MRKVARSARSQLPALLYVNRRCLIGIGGYQQMEAHYGEWDNLPRSAGIPVSSEGWRMAAKN